MHTYKKIILGASILSFVLLGGCSPKLRYKVFSFFFDGVPEPILVAADTIAGHDSLKVIASTGKKSDVPFYSHPPYSEKKCDKCHNVSSGNQLLKSMPDLCYGCHSALNNGHKVLHGPVASGYCLNCHNPHIAKFKKLLLRQGQQLCLDCHDPKSIFQNKIHEKIAQTLCTDCHDPHGGDNRGFLRDGTCNNCHESFGSKYQYLHGPVAGGYCNRCHGSHQTNVKKLLLREDEKLCLDCHDREHTLKNTAHKDSKKTNCTGCHNPHGGKDKYFLN